MHILCQKSIATARRPFSGSSHPPSSTPSFPYYPSPSLLYPRAPWMPPQPLPCPIVSLLALHRPAQPFLARSTAVSPHRPTRSRLSCHSPCTARHTPPGWPLPLLMRAPALTRPGMSPTHGMVLTPWYWRFATGKSVLVWRYANARCHCPIPHHREWAPAAAPCRWYQTTAVTSVCLNGGPIYN